MGFPITSVLFTLVKRPLSKRYHWSQELSYNPMGLYDTTVGLISLMKEGKDVNKIQAISRNYIIQTLFLNMDKEMENNFFVKKKTWEIMEPRDIDWNNLSKAK